MHPFLDLAPISTSMLAAFPKSKTFGGCRGIERHWREIGRTLDRLPEIIDAVIWSGTLAFSLVQSRM